MDGGVIVSIVAFLFASLFAGYLALSEFQKPKFNWIRFAVLLFFFLGLLGFGVVDKLISWQSSNDGTTKIITNDSIGFKSTQDTIGILAKVTDSGFRKTDSLISKIPKDKSSHPIVPSLDPLLDVFSLVAGVKDPVVESLPNSDNLRLVIEVGNTREAEAYLTGEKIVTINYVNDTINVVSAINRKPANEVVYYSKQFLAQHVNFYSYFYYPPVDRRNPLDTLYFCFQLEYTNKVGIAQRPLQKIYSFNSTQIGIQLASETQKNDQIKKFLTKKKYW